MNKRKKIPKKMEELLEYVNRHWGKTQKCHHCKGEPQGVCQSCMSLVYCGSTCQTKDWERGHFESCYIAGRGREDEEPEERVKARRTEEGRVEEREYLEVIDISAIPKDVLNRIAAFLSVRDIKNLRQASRLIEERIRLAYFSKFRFRLTPEVLQSPIAPYIQAVQDYSGGTLSRQLAMIQERSFLKDVEIFWEEAQDYIYDPFDTYRWETESNFVDWHSILFLKDLIRLRLDFNGLEYIPSDITILVNLQVLSLRNNRIEEIPRELGNLTNLQVLNLSGNQIAKIPRELGNLTSLRRLDLGVNQIAKIPRELGNLTSLRRLDLGENRLIEIPRELGNLTNLQKLSLAGNDLTEIPRELGNLTNLQKLEMDQNRLTGIPKELVNLTNLQELYLHRNRLTEITRELGNLNNLQELYLSFNRLTEIPRELGNLTNLRELSLFDNRLTEIPRELGNLSNLQKFYLGENRLSDTEKAEIRSFMPSTTNVYF